MKVAIILCPPWNIDMPSIGIASIYAFLKKDFKITFFDLNLDLYKSITKSKYTLLRYWRYYLLYFKCYPLFYFRNPDEKIHKLRELNQEFIDKWTKQVLKINPAVVCFSCHNSSTSLKLAQNIKQQNKKIITIFGGPDCSLSMFGKDIIKKRFVDFVIVGEGEIVLKNLLNALKRTKKIKKMRGVLSKVDGKIFFGGDYLPIKNLDSLPFPDFSIFNLQDFKRKSLPLSFSRGCPHNCPFCFDRIFWKKFRYKSTKKIIKEILHIKKRYGINIFGITDSLVNGNPVLLEKLCDNIIKRRMDIFMVVSLRIDKHLTLPFLKKLQKAGVYSVFYGIESGSPKVLKEMGKESDIRLIENVIKNTYNAGIRIKSTWMTGFPTETLKDFLKTLSVIWKNRKYLGGGIKAGSCMILPSTILYKKAENYRIRDYKKIRCWKVGKFSFTNRMTKYILLYMYIKTINYFYNRD